MRDFLLAFYRFSRFHTIIGTVLSITVLFVIAHAVGRPGDLQLGLLLWTLVACLGANIYIVGLNQLTDIEIDKINKPYLPLASGAFSRRTGLWLIVIAVLISLLIAWYYGRYLLATVLISLFLGTIYSLPPIRLKRFYFWAAFCIIAIRGLVVNFLLFLHFHYELNSTTRIPAIIWLLAGIIFVYSIAIAWFKDVPDVEGDRRYAIRTLTMRLGARTIFRIGIGLLLLTFVIAVWLSFLYLPTTQAQALLFWQFFLALLLWWWYRQIRLGEQASVRQFYLRTWALFFLEYIGFAVVSWL